MINIENLSYSYNKKDSLVLKNIDLKIEEGKVNVLLGKNGCGKTTLIRVMTGLEKTKQGDVKYGEKNLNDIAIKERAKLFSYVPQRSKIVYDFYVQDYLMLGKAGEYNWCQKPKSDDIENVICQAQEFGMGEFLGRRLGELSGGEQQLLSICRALIQDAKYLILDEPTSALDIVNQHKVLLNLKEICENHRKTVILTTHNPNHALFLGAEVFLMDDGRIIRHGKAKDIVCPDSLKEAYGDNIIFSKELGYDEVAFRS